MTRQCIRCGSNGPFYASQAQSYCIPCHRAATRARYSQQSATILAAAAAVRLRRLLAIPLHQRTRRQQKQVLDHTAPPGKKICAYCWLALWPGMFSSARGAKDGRDSYCRSCRRVMDSLRRHQKRQTRGD